MWRIRKSAKSSVEMTKPFSQIILNSPALNVNAFLPSELFVKRICGNTLSPSAPLMAMSLFLNTTKCF